MGTEVKVNTRRLLLLARYLEKVPKKHFSMSTWGSGKIGKRYGNECGFTGCAMGHACFIPSFKKAGLVFKNGSVEWNIENPKGPLNDGYYAAAMLFNFEYPDAYNLFNPRDRVGETPKQVANRIRKFVAQVKK